MDIYQIDNLYCVFNSAPIGMAYEQANAISPTIDLTRYEKQSDGQFLGYCVTSALVGFCTVDRSILSTDNGTQGLSMYECRPVYSVHPCYISPDPSSTVPQLNHPPMMAAENSQISDLMEIVDREIRSSPNEKNAERR